MRRILRYLLLLVSFLLPPLTVLLALGLGGLGVLLIVGKRNVTLDSDTIPFWPDFLRGIEFLAWSGPYLIGLAVSSVFVILPLVLALLEWLADRGQRES